MLSGYFGNTTVTLIILNVIPKYIQKNWAS